MDGEKTYEALRRYAAMLLALAVLAERTAGRSLIVRCLVLWFLRRAEARASAFAAEVTPLVPIGDLAFQSGDEPDEAARLAESFRALAAIFFVLADHHLRLPRLWAGRHVDPGGHLARERPTALLLSLSAAHRPRAPPRQFIPWVCSQN